MNDQSGLGPVALGDGAAVFRSRGVYPAAKRGFDVAAALVLSLLTLPLIVFLAVLVCRDGGPAFHRQRRLGRNGQPFMMWKLRTMVPDAEAALAAYLARDESARREWDLAQKLRNDVRITPIGRFMRKYSLDELPQLWNVVAGEMSLVGPRPMLVEQWALYPGVAYLALRPGITGLWQVSGRNAFTFADRATFDTDYAQRLSWRTDAWILLRTVRIVLAGTGC